MIEEGLDGRTTDAPDPGSPISGAKLDGSAYLPACLASHLPVDLVVIRMAELVLILADQKETREEEVHPRLALCYLWEDMRRQAATPETPSQRVTHVPVESPPMFRVVRRSWPALPRFPGR